MRRGTEHHLRVVRSLSELPEPVRGTYETLPPQDIRQIIIIPPQEYVFANHNWREKLMLTRRQTPQRTLFFSETQLIIIEESTPLQTLSIPLADVLALNLKTVLLYAALELVWQQDGDVQKRQIEFNSVGMRFIEPELTQIRTYFKNQQTGIPQTGQPVEAVIHDLPFKFQSYAYQSLLPAEGVWGVIYEPAMRRPGTTFLPYLAPNRVLLLTDYHLIMLSDSLLNWRGREQSPYRIEQHYFPRQHIRALTGEQTDLFDWVTLSLGMADAQHEVRLPLSPENARALQTSMEEWLPQLAGVI